MMDTLSQYKTHAHTSAVSAARPMQSYWAEIVEIQPEAPGVGTYWLKFLDSTLQSSYRFEPGQFNMLGVPGLGESAISISSSPEAPERVGHTIRFVGNVTHAISRMKVGDVVGVRGPFGTAWPINKLKGQDLVLAAGGIGLPPLRSALYSIMNHRQDYGRVVVLYGARTPQDLQFTREYKEWEKAGVELMVTVDRADDSWKGLVGVVPILFYQQRVNPAKTSILTCGPEIMIRFVIFEALARRIPAERIYVSMERNMKCGLGLCGHCQLGPFFVCKDGPVFSFDQIQPYFNVEDL
jgi:NAD(P)H-flavin reductase